MRSARTPVNWLRTFEVAARHLSLTGAAAELSVTPAAVSQQVRLLEQRLGSALFVRHARGLRLTRAGESLVPACRESFERLETTLHELFGGHRAGLVVVRVALGFARGWLLDRLAGFARRHPGIPVRLVASVWASDPPDAGVELDLRLASGPLKGVVSHRLTQDLIFPVCHPRLIRSAPRIRHPSDLAHHTLLSTIGFAQGWKDWCAAARVDYPFADARILEFDSMRIALDMAELGHGVALARTSYAADLLAARRLQALFDVRLEAADDVYLFHRPGIDPRSPASQLRDWLLADPPQSNSRRRRSSRTRSRSGRLR